MIQTLPPSILGRLGITDVSEAALVQHHEAPEQAVAQGRAVASLTAAVASLTMWNAVDDVAQRYAHAPGVVAFIQEDVAEVLAGRPEHGNGRLVFDSDAETACVRTADGSVYVARHGAITQYALPAQDPLADLAVDAAPPRIGAMDSVRWADELRAEPWLRSAVAELAAHASGLSDAASAGLLARLWVPARGSTVTPEQLPRERVRAWITAATPEQRDALEEHAVHRAAELTERIPGVRDDAALRALIEQRDDLQSVLRVLRISGCGAALQRALQELDDEAADHLESFANLLPALSEAPDADRWMAVAWQEPDAWWTGAA